MTTEEAKIYEGNEIMKWNDKRRGWNLLNEMIENEMIEVTESEMATEGVEIY